MAMTHHYPPCLDMTQFADQLRKLRSARNVTQTRLAQLLAVSPRVYNRWETGDALPHFDTCIKIAEALGVSLDELAGRTDESDAPHLRNPELRQLTAQLDRLPDNEQQALILVLDGFVRRAQMAKVMAQMPQPAKRKVTRKPATTR
jgi:transcriptional regulator with XRE-family HTH domain